MSKFAAMSASLLVRKGEAAPSTVTPMMWDDRPSVAPVRKTETRESAPAGKPRRIVLNLASGDYERLGLVAVKRGTSRHALAAEALAQYFATLAADYDCACLGNCREVCAAE